jgi:hypothetical protein
MFPHDLAWSFPYVFLFIAFITVAALWRVIQLSPPALYCPTIFSNSGWDKHCSYRLPTGLLVSRKTDTLAPESTGRGFHRACNLAYDLQPFIRSFLCPLLPTFDIAIACAAAETITLELFSIYDSQPPSTFTAGVPKVDRSFQCGHSTRRPWSGPWRLVSRPEREALFPDIFHSHRSNSLSRVGPRMASLVSYQAFMPCLATSPPNLQT